MEGSDALVIAALAAGGYSLFKAFEEQPTSVAGKPTPPPQPTSQKKPNLPILNPPVNNPPSNNPIINNIINPPVNNPPANNPPSNNPPFNNPPANNPPVNNPPVNNPPANNPPINFLLWLPGSASELIRPSSIPSTLPTTSYSGPPFAYEDEMWSDLLTLERNGKLELQFHLGWGTVIPGFFAMNPDEKTVSFSLPTYKNDGSLTLEDFTRPYNRPVVSLKHPHNPTPPLSGPNTNDLFFNMHTQWFQGPNGTIHGFPVMMQYYSGLMNLTYHNAAYYGLFGALGSTLKKSKPQLMKLYRNEFPDLTVEVVERFTNSFNCIAWTIGVRDRWVWNEIDTNGDGLSSFSEFVSFYGRHGLLPTTVESEAEVAIFGFESFGKLDVKHGAVREKGSNYWLSKMGQGGIIRHEGLNAFDTSPYGKLLLMFKRV